MKTTTLLRWFIGLTLLVMAPNCKRENDLPPGLVADATTLPQPPQGCRIVRTTYKDPSVGRTGAELWEPETIKLDDGNKIEVSCVSKTTYTYDQQGRIVETRSQLLNNLYWLHRYTYTPTALIGYQEFLAKGATKTTILNDTTSLNERGFISRFKGLGEPYWFYNQDDQLIDTDAERPGLTRTYVDGNKVEHVEYQSWGMRNGEWFAYDRFLKRFSYNLSRPNLPVILPFRGRESRNLPTKEVWHLEASPDFGTRTVYQKTYNYLYDKQGQVRRQVVYGKPLIGGSLIEDDLYGVGVTDYEYECP